MQWNIYLAHHHICKILYNWKQNPKKLYFSTSLSLYSIDREFILTMVAGGLLFCCCRKKPEKEFWNGNCDIYWVIISHYHLQEAGGSCLPFETDGSPAMEGVGLVFFLLDKLA